MRVLVQRVSSASVRVDGEIVGQIGPGLLLLVGIREEEREETVGWVARRVAGLRIFRDEDGRMNRSVLETGGAALVVSQFTLYGDTQRGMRPSFVAAAPGERAEPLVADFVEAIRSLGIRRVETGRFGADMEVASVNDGPVTIWVEREA